MLGLYRSLLHLYPAAHRRQFGSEMCSVFSDLEADAAAKGPAALAMFRLRELSGLLSAALWEHVRFPGSDRPWLSLPLRRFTMQREFRFPKSTAVLMALILAAIVWAIEKGKAIQASLPNVNPQIGPIQPMHQTFLPSVALMVLFFYAAGILGWAVLYALRRSGVHRLDAMSHAGK